MADCRKGTTDCLLQISKFDIYTFEPLHSFLFFTITYLFICPTLQLTSSPDHKIYLTNERSRAWFQTTSVSLVADI